MYKERAVMPALATRPHAHSRCTTNRTCTGSPFTRDTHQHQHHQHHQHQNQQHQHPAHIGWSRDDSWGTRRRSLHRGGTRGFPVLNLCFQRLWMLCPRANPWHAQVQSRLKQRANAPQKPPGRGFRSTDWRWAQQTPRRLTATSPTSPKRMSDRASGEFWFLSAGQCHLQLTPITVWLQLTSTYIHTAQRHAHARTHTHTQMMQTITILWCNKQPDIQN